MCGERDSMQGYIRLERVLSLGGNVDTILHDAIMTLLI